MAGGQRHGVPTGRGRNGLPASSEWTEAWDCIEHEEELEDVRANEGRDGRMFIDDGLKDLLVILRTGQA
jgi:hypothetical protein